MSEVKPESFEGGKPYHERGNTIPEHSMAVVNTVLKAWLASEDEKRPERKSFSCYFKVLMAFELIVIAAIIFIDMIGNYNLDTRIIVSLISGVFVQTLGLVWLILKYLFDDEKDKFLNLVASVLNGKIDKSKKPTKAEKSRAKLIKNLLLNKKIPE